MKTIEDRTNAIDVYLRSLHVLSLQPAERKQIASRLANCRFGFTEVRMIWDESRLSARDDDIARGMFVKTLRDPALAQAVVDDLNDRRERIKLNEGSEPSSLSNASADNPYGWKNPDVVRVSDHGRPGDWNGYRQCYNMTETERVEAGEHDCRRKGCSRFEVMGWFEGKRVKAGKDIAPDPFWDQERVNHAKGLAAQEDPATKGRDIYGV